MPFKCINRAVGFDISHEIACGQVKQYIVFDWFPFTKAVVVDGTRPPLEQLSTNPFHWVNQCRHSHSAHLTELEPLDQPIKAGISFTGLFACKEAAMREQVLGCCLDPSAHIREL
jgi:hypothetical protein